MFILIETLVDVTIEVFYRNDFYMRLSWSMETGPNMERRLKCIFTSRTKMCK